MKLSRRQLRKLLNEESRILEALGLYKSPEPKKENETLESLLKRIKELENRVKELEVKGTD